MVTAFYVGTLPFRLLSHHEREVLYLLPDLLNAYVFVEFLDSLVECLFPILCTFYLVGGNNFQRSVALSVMLLCNPLCKIVCIVAVGIC